MARPDDEDIILRLIGDVRELRSSVIRLELKFDGALRALEEATREFAVGSSRTFERMETTLETMLDSIGGTHARLDEHEARIAALEVKKA